MNKVICKICNGDTQELFEAKVLQEYKVHYYQCAECRFIQTEEPYWLDEAYNNAITALDIGYVERNIYFSQLCEQIIKKGFSKKGVFLDYGGGYGLFVRMMRDRGFDFYNYDTHCDGIFSRFFDNTRVDDQNYELISCFEVFEHLTNPLEDISTIFESSSSLLFSTELIPFDKSVNKDWWYFIFETGQHVSFYTIDTLEFLAKKYNKNLYTNGKNLHLLTEKELPKNILNPNIFFRLKRKLENYGRSSLLESDVARIKQKLAERK